MGDSTVGYCTLGQVRDATSAGLFTIANSIAAGDLYGTPVMPLNDRSSRMRYQLTARLNEHNLREVSNGPVFLPYKPWAVNTSMARTFLLTLSGLLFKIARTNDRILYAAVSIFYTLLCTVWQADRPYTNILL